MANQLPPSEGRFAYGGVVPENGRVTKMIIAHAGDNVMHPSEASVGTHVHVNFPNNKKTS